MRNLCVILLSIISVCFNNLSFLHFPLLLLNSVRRSCYLKIVLYHIQTAPLSWTQNEGFPSPGVFPLLCWPYLGSQTPTVSTWGMSHSPWHNYWFNFLEHFSMQVRSPQNIKLCLQRTPNWAKRTDAGTDTPLSKPLHCLSFALWTCHRDHGHSLSP